MKVEPFEFTQFDESSVLEGAIVAFEEETGEVLYAGDERRYIINSFVYAAKIIAEKMNYLSNQNFSDTADEEALVQKGNDIGVIRLKAEKALVPIKFILNGIKAFDVTIKKGTRVTYDGLHFFQTKEEAVICAGATEIVVDCEATKEGSSGYNDIPASEITTLADSVLYVEKVANTEASSGGADVEDIEDLRERIKLKPRSFSVAGPEDAYIYFTKTADSSVGNVYVYNNKAVATVVVLCKDGSIPNSLLLERILENLNNKKVRPLTDQVVVKAPELLTYGIDISYTISKADEKNIETISKNVEAAVNTFIDEQKKEIGKDVNPDILRKYILNAGASTVIVTNPSYIDVAVDAVAQLSGNAVIKYSGLK